MSIPERSRPRRRTALLVLVPAGVLGYSSSTVEPAALAALTCLLAGLACGVAAAGAGAPWLVLRAVLGDDRPAPGQLQALRHTARGTLVAGLAIGLLAALLLFVSFRLPEAERSPARLTGWAMWSLLGPLAGVATGRVWLGGLADALGDTDPARDPAVLLGALSIAMVTFVALCLPAG